MKKTMTFLFALICSVPFVYGQDGGEYYLSGDTLYTPSGYNIYKGGTVKIGAGTMPDGNFKYIQINQGSFFRFSSTNGSSAGVNEANALRSTQSGHVYNVYRISEIEDRQGGRKYYLIIGLDKMYKHQVDIDLAIKSGEIEVPFQYAVNKKKEGEETFSLADELMKLSDLKEKGILTDDEFQAQKQKLLNK